MHRYAACNYENCILSSQNLTICILTLTSSSSYDPQHFKQVSNNFNLFLEVFSRLGFCSLVCKFYRITQSIIMTHWLNRKNLPKSQAVLMTWITGDFAGWFQSDFKLFQSGFGGPFWRVIYIYNMYFTSTLFNQSCGWLWIRRQNLPQSVKKWNF